jgi:cell wall-associated NlpC family hydrolase
VGAFSVVGNAVRLTDSLNEHELQAYYFVHESGLYKVRFGDFASKEEARQEAENLKRKGVFAEYYIVSPEDYAVAKRRQFGSHFLRGELVSTAQSFIGLPYSWGGVSPEQGFDCSGLTMAVYKLNGLNLPRSSRGQWGTGTPIERNQLQKGDLVFFATGERGRVSHVGIYAGENTFIHAPGKNKRIRSESLSSQYFQKRFLGARTYLK